MAARFDVTHLGIGAPDQILAAARIRRETATPVLAVTNIELSSLA